MTLHICMILDDLKVREQAFNDRNQQVPATIAEINRDPNSNKRFHNKEMKNTPEQYNSKRMII